MCRALISVSLRDEKEIEGGVRGFRGGVSSALMCEGNQLVMPVIIMLTDDLPAELCNSMDIYGLSK